MTSPSPITPQQAAAALAWLQNAGADILTGDKAGNWLETQAPSLSPSGAETAKEGRTSAHEKTRTVKAASTTQQDAAAFAEQKSAASPLLSARTLGELAKEARDYPASLNTPQSAFVFADGNANARIMVIGEAPGQQEEHEGKPFVGPAGQLLDRMLAAIGLDRHGEENGVYITNLSPWRPPRNRTPNMQEAAECLPLLHQHIAIHKPRLILTVGGTSAKALLATETGIMRLRGAWREVEIEGGNYRVLPTFHPAFLLRQPEQKRLAWQDLQAFRAALKTVS